MLSHIFKFLMGIFCILAPLSIRADVIVQYNTAGGTTSLAPFAVDASVSADNLEAGSGIDVLNFSTFNFTNWDPANTSYSDAVADDEKWTWGFDVTAVATDITLSTMDIRLDRSGSGPDDFEIKASVNGGAEVSLLTHDYNDSSSGVNFLGVDISALGTLSTGDSIVFTLAAFNAESTGGTFDLETITYPGGNDSIVINGTISGGTPDTIAPSVSSLSPADDAVDVSVSAGLTITFDETVQAGAGNLTVHLASDDSTVATIAIGSAGINGAAVTFNLVGDLSPSTAYYVSVPSGLIEDISGNSYAGFTDTTTWNFTTEAADLTGPVVTSLTPADDATEVPVDASLIAVFDESIQKGNGNVTVHQSSDDAIVATIDVTTGAASVAGSTLTITLPGDLAFNRAYYVQVPSSAVSDLSSNAFIGISDTTTWSFTTAAAPPTVDATGTTGLFAAARILSGGDAGPADFYAEGNGNGAFSCFAVASFQFNKLLLGIPDSSQIDAIVNARLTLTHNDRTFTGGSEVEFLFTTDTYAGDFAGLSFNSAIVNGIDNSQFTFDPISVGKFTYTRDDSNGGEEDTYVLDLSSVASNILAAVQSGAEFNLIMVAPNAADIITYSGLNNTFDPGNPRLEIDVAETPNGVVDNAAPTVTSFTPADDSVGSQVFTNLVLQFNEIIEAGAGNITLHLASSGAVVETFDVTGSRVSVDAGAVTIDPTNNLLPETSYYIQIESGAIQDPAGNDYVGIADVTTWNFTTTTPAIDEEGPFEVSENALNGAVVGDLSPTLSGLEGFEYAILAGGASTPSMMKSVDEDYRVTPLFTIGDTLSGSTGSFHAGSAGSYTPVGVLDGIGAHELDANTVRLYTNHELQSDEGYAYTLASGTSVTGARISYFDVDKATRRIVDSGIAYDTVYDRSGNLVTTAAQMNEAGNGSEGFDRMCSSSLYEADTFGVGRGIVDRIYFNGEEATKSFGHPHGGTIWALDTANGDMHAVPAMGRGSWENVTQVDTGTTTHVAFALGDDLGGAPLYLYVGEKGKDASGAVATDFLSRNGLAFGKLYVWKADNGDTTPQNFFGTGSTRAGTFVEIAAISPAPGTEATDVNDYRDGDTLRTVADALGGFSFSRPEDLAYNPASPNQFAFASTGRSALYPMDTWGTVYLVDVDFTTISAPIADIEILYDGDDQGGGQFFSSEEGLRNPDNLDWADDGFIYVQEDRAGGASFGAFGNAGEEASIWKLDPGSSTVNRLTQMCREVILPLGSTDPSTTDIGNWESSGILDVSNLFGEPGGTLFFFNVQAHSVTDGLIDSLNLAQGAQLCLLEKTPQKPAFRMNPNSGVILVNDSDAIDQSVQDTYYIRIQAFDGVTQDFNTVRIDVTEDGIVAPSRVRFASYNIALSETGGLVDALSTPTSASAAQDIAEVIQINRPDVLLLNEFDYDEAGAAIKNFQENYLEIGQNGASPQHYGYVYIAPVNTGVHSGFDLDNNGSVVSTEGSQAYGDDAFGFGQYPGQYGMALLSKFPIDTENVRTFQKFLWKDMPNNLLPPDPNDTDGDSDLTNYYNAAERDVFRLSSKSHWDIPVIIGSTTIHALCGHPTPPTFDDGTETDLNNPTLVDENGRRNHDEIRFWADYISGSSYIYDDAEWAAAGNTTPASPQGGFVGGEKFVILGDYNADDNEGDSTDNPALKFFTTNALINNTVTPVSSPSAGPEPDDTAGFSGGVRVDYALPSANQTILDAEVYWPTSSGIVAASDHRMVWVELERALTNFDIASYYAGSSGLTGTALFNALHDLIDNHTPIDYGTVPDVMRVIDEDRTDDTQMRLIYSNATLAKTSTGWNREHVWPRSRGVGEDGDDFADIHHLFPAEVNVNSLRSNLAFDNSQGATTSDPFAPESTEDGNSFEPLDRDKGLVARALLYMAVRYDGVDALTSDLTLGSSAGSTSMGVLDTLLEWNRTYPPSDYEKARNNAIYEGVEVSGVVYAQGNRNPFIDFYHLADLLFLSSSETTYEKWAAQEFTYEQLLDAAVSGRAVDGNGDGLDNYAHFLTNTLVDGSGPSALQVDEPAADMLEFTFFRPLGNLVPEAASLMSTTDLVAPLSWSEVTDWESDATITTEGDYEKIVYEHTIDSETDEKRFWRVEYE